VNQEKQEDAVQQVEPPAVAAENQGVRTEAAKDAKGAQTLMRALDILDEVISGPVRSVDLSRKLGLSRTTTNRLALALKTREYLSATRDGYALGPKLLHLGAVVQLQTDYVAAARPFMERLSEQTGFCVFIGKREGDYSRHLERVTGRQRLRVATTPGDKRPIAETGLGKALLLDDDDASRERLYKLATPKAGQKRVAHWLSDMRAHAERSVVLHESELDDGVRSIAAPVRDASGRICIALSIAGAVHYLPEDVMAELSGVVRQTAVAISETLGYRR
jgi:DNA-binding IclR family transcriptional regulator